MAMIGAFYMVGTGVARDFAKAAQYLQRGTEQTQKLELCPALQQ